MTNPDPTAIVYDDVHTLIDSIVRTVTDHVLENNHRQLASHIRESLLKLPPLVAKSERWELVALDDAPAELHSIHTLLRDLSDVAAAIGFGGLKGRDIARAARGGPSATSLVRAAEAARTYTTRWLNRELDDLVRRATAEGVVLDLDVQPSGEFDSYWPPADVAVFVRCDDLGDWLKVYPWVLDAVKALRDVAHLPPTLVCPTIGDEPVSSFSQVIISAAYPGAEVLARRRGDAAPEEAAHGLASVLQSAVDALTTLSGLNDLATRRPLAEIYKSHAETCRTILEDSLQSARDFGEDAVVGSLLQLLVEVVALVDSETSANPHRQPGTFASEVFMLATGTETVTGNVLAALRVLAAQWDIDPSRAERLLEQFEQA
jgi:hypothetical protein